MSISSSFCLQCNWITSSPRHCVTAPPHHRATASPRHRVICLAPCHQTSQSFALPSATKPVSHLTCPVPPHHRATTSPRHRVTASPRHRVICLAPCHQTSQSFALPPATKPVSHLTCPVPPHHRVTTSPRHRVTAPPRHHATASPHHRVTASPRHHIKIIHLTSLNSIPWISIWSIWSFYIFSIIFSDWLMLTSTVLICKLSPPQPIRYLSI